VAILRAGQGRLAVDRPDPGAHKGTVGSCHGAATGGALLMCVTTRTHELSTALRRKMRLSIGGQM